MSPATAPATEAQRQGLVELSRTGELWSLLLAAKGTAVPGNHKVKISTHAASAASLPPFVIRQRSSLPEGLCGWYRMDSSDSEINEQEEMHHQL